MTDLIDRQAAIDEFYKYPNWRWTTLDVMNRLSDLPAAQREPQWIPVSERLPERGKEVLVTRDYDGRADHHKSCQYVEVASCYGDNDDIAWFSCSDEYKMSPRNHKVIAWMPLPEPYKEDDNDE